MTTPQSPLDPSGVTKRCRGPPPNGLGITAAEWVALVAASDSRLLLRISRRSAGSAPAGEDAASTGFVPSPPFRRTYTSSTARERHRTPLSPAAICGRSRPLHTADSVDS